MKMNRRKTGIILLIIFTLLTMISGGMFLRQYMDSKKSSENFEQLEELVDEIPEETDGWMECEKCKQLTRSIQKEKMVKIPVFSMRSTEHEAMVACLAK